MQTDRSVGPTPTRPAPGDSDVVVSPVVVVSQSFAARPSSMPDAGEFVQRALAGAALEPADTRVIHDAINDTILRAASPSIGTFQVVVRLFPDDAEVEILASAECAQQNPAVEDPPGSFADWFSGVLREQGLSQEAAARHLGVSVRTVSRWVRGTTEPRLRDVRRVSEVFGPVRHR